MSLRKRQKRWKYYIPFYGTRLLLKRIERLEREATGESTTAQYYEARMESLYEALLARVRQNDAIYFDQARGVPVMDEQKT